VHYVLQRFAVCCSVLQRVGGLRRHSFIIFRKICCVAVRCSVCCSVLQWVPVCVAACVAVCVAACVAVCCSEWVAYADISSLNSVRLIVLQCIAVCCSVWQCFVLCVATCVAVCVVVCFSVLQCVAESGWPTPAFLHWIP